MTEQRLYRRDIWELERKWMQVFGRVYSKLTGRMTTGIEPSLFRQPYMDRYLVGAEAELEYQQATASELYVILDRGRSGYFIDFPDGDKPPLARFDDYNQAVLFPPTFSWTAVLEEFSEPSFAYSDWVAYAGPARDEAE